MRHIISHLGESGNAFESVAGLGDYITTSTSTFSANYEAGAQIARGEKPRECEGITAFQTLSSQTTELSLPLLKSLSDILTKKLRLLSHCYS